MRTRRDDEAMSPLLGFIVAIGVYVLALTVFVAFASTPPTTSSTVDADLQNRAGTALELMLTESGTLATGADWVTNPDAMTRFGMVDDTSNFLDYDKIKIMRKGKMATEANTFPDYPEVKEALALDEHQFHIRTYPVLIGVDDANWAKMRGVRVAYLGDATDPSSSATIQSGVYTAGNVKRIWVDIKNTDPNPMVFTVNYDIDVTNSKDVSTTRQTRLLAQNQNETVSLRIHPLADWNIASLKVTMVTSDNYGVCTCTTPAQSPATVETGTATIHYLAETGASYYVKGDTVTVKVDHFTKTGGKTTGQDARLRIYPPSAQWSTTPAATPLVDTTCGAQPACGTLPSQNNHRWEHTCSCATLEGVWTVVVTDLAGGRDSTLTYWVDDAALFSTPPLDAVAAKERQYIDELVEDFDTDTYTAATPDGDVFVDTNQDVRKLTPFIDDNPPACDDADRRYDMLIVGSNTAHNALVKIKDEVARFVDCGGTVVALGSSRSGTEWLQEVYNIALRDGAGGGISSPDPTHPLLNVPEKLAWNNYDDSGYVWDISQSNVIWSHAVDGATADELVLGITDQGALEGNVVLTGWTPGDLTTPQDDEEAKKLLHNLMAQGYQMLFLDYGPEIPDGVPVGSSSRLAVVPYVDLATDPANPVDAPYIEVKVVLYVWRG